MSAIFKKLNLKEQKEILVANAPESFEPELRSLEGVNVRRSLEEGLPVAFTLAFVTKLAEIERVAAALAQKAPGDAVVWFAYPKGTSKKYKCEFNRDTGWEALGRAGFEPVRQVAIDEDWSALRFRRAEFIKTLTRDASWAMSEEGKKKASKKSPTKGS
ncbi:MAG: hypothetical protein A2Z16_12825 [Chloroflexi bacterium RBG_16_54_18]|nr:MAG: hypothetical protein A2Z16_12825 [Chloroflexi bacterium RBG_16_54_18]